MRTHPHYLLLACLVTLGVSAQDLRERSYLSLAQRQITIVKQLANHASSTSTDDAGVSYRFDYSRFAADLERMRQGIHKYLSASRAQPAEMIELTGDYRAEAPHSSSPDEHD